MRKPMCSLYRRLLQIKAACIRTTYVGQVMAHEIGKDPDNDEATRFGERAMLLYSLGECCITNS
jgi:hypothetical protein